METMCSQGDVRRSQSVWRLTTKGHVISCLEHTGTETQRRERKPGHAINTAVANAFTRAQSMWFLYVSVAGIQTPVPLRSATEAAPPRTPPLLQLRGGVVVLKGCALLSVPVK